MYLKSIQMFPIHTLFIQNLPLRLYHAQQDLKKEHQH